MFSWAKHQASNLLHRTVSKLAPASLTVSCNVIIRALKEAFEPDALAQGSEGVSPMQSGIGDSGLIQRDKGIAVESRVLPDGTSCITMELARMKESILQGLTQVLSSADDTQDGLETRLVIQRAAVTSLTIKWRQGEALPSSVVVDGVEVDAVVVKQISASSAANATDYNDDDDDVYRGSSEACDPASAPSNDEDYPLLGGVDRMIQGAIASLTQNVVSWLPGVVVQNVRVRCLQTCGSPIYSVPSALRLDEHPSSSAQRADKLHLPLLSLHLPCLRFSTLGVGYTAAANSNDGSKKQLRVTLDPVTVAVAQTATVPGREEGSSLRYIDPAAASSSSRSGAVSATLSARDDAASSNWLMRLQDAGFDLTFDGSTITDVGVFGVAAFVFDTKGATNLVRLCDFSTPPATIDTMLQMMHDGRTASLVATAAAARVARGASRPSREASPKRHSPPSKPLAIHILTCNVIAALVSSDRDGSWCRQRISMDEGTQQVAARLLADCDEGALISQIKFEPAASTRSAPPSLSARAVPRERLADGFTTMTLDVKATTVLLAVKTASTVPRALVHSDGFSLSFSLMQTSDGATATSLDVSLLVTTIPLDPAVLLSLRSSKVLQSLARYPDIVLEIADSSAAEDARRSASKPSDGAFEKKRKEVRSRVEGLRRMQSMASFTDLTLRERPGEDSAVAEQGARPALHADPAVPASVPTSPPPTTPTRATSSIAVRLAQPLTVVLMPMSGALRIGGDAGGSVIFVKRKDGDNESSNIAIAGISVETVFIAGRREALWNALLAYEPCGGENPLTWYKLMAQKQRSVWMSSAAVKGGLVQALPSVNDLMLWGTQVACGPLEIMLWIAKMQATATDLQEHFGFAPHAPPAQELKMEATRSQPKKQPLRNDVPKPPFKWSWLCHASSHAGGSPSLSALFSSAVTGYTTPEEAEHSTATAMRPSAAVSIDGPVVSAGSQFVQALLSRSATVEVSMRAVFQFLDCDPKSPHNQQNRAMSDAKVHKLSGVVLRIEQMKGRHQRFAPQSTFRRTMLNDRTDHFCLAQQSTMLDIGTLRASVFAVENGQHTANDVVRQDRYTTVTPAAPPSARGREPSAQQHEAERVRTNRGVERETQDGHTALCCIQRFVKEQRAAPELRLSWTTLCFAPLHPLYSAAGRLWRDTPTGISATGTMIGAVSWLVGGTSPHQQSNAKREGDLSPFPALRERVSVIVGPPFLDLGAIAVLSEILQRTLQADDQLSQAKEPVEAKRSQQSAKTGTATIATEDCGEQQPIFLLDARLSLPSVFTQSAFRSDRPSRIPIDSRRFTVRDTWADGAGSSIARDWQDIVQVVFGGMPLQKRLLLLSTASWTGASLGLTSLWRKVSSSFASKKGVASDDGTSYAASVAIGS